VINNEVEGKHKLDIGAVLTILVVRQDTIERVRQWHNGMSS
jgi:hypothetical protein